MTHDQPILFFFSLWRSRQIEMVRLGGPSGGCDMATANLRVVHNDHDQTLAPANMQHSPRSLNRLREVREQQGVTLRTCARRMHLDMRTLRSQEEPDADLKLSDLRRWQTVLDVPLAELVEESDLPLSRPVMERARMVRIMKTAASLLEAAETPEVRRFATVLIDQLTEVMPELSEVSAWHSVGQRRTLDEVGKIAEKPVSTRTMMTNILSAQDD